jgi:hypothetical protein
MKPLIIYYPFSCILATRHQDIIAKELETAKSNLFALFNIILRWLADGAAWKV